MKIFFHVNPLNLTSMNREEYSMACSWITSLNNNNHKLYLPLRSIDQVMDWFISYKSPIFPRLYKDNIDSDTKFAYYYPDIRKEPDSKLVKILADYDLLLVVDRGSIPQFQELLPDIEVKQLKQGVNPIFFETTLPYNPLKTKWNWFFAGSPYPGREEFIKNLIKIDNGVIFGNGWQVISNVKQWKGVDIYNYELALQISRSILTVNYNAFSEFNQAFSTRIYKTMASGGVLFTNKMKGFNEIFEPNKHYLEFKDFEEMKYILEDPLEFFSNDKLTEISRNAKLEVLNNHTYETRGNELMEILKNVK